MGAQLIPFFTDNDVISGRVTGAPVAAMTFVSFAAGGKGTLPNIATATASARANGVADLDGAVGKTIPFHTRNCVPVLAGEDLVVGDRVKAGADGKAVKFLTGEEALIVGTVYANAATGQQAAVHLSL